MHKVEKKTRASTDSPIVYKDMEDTLESLEEDSQNNGAGSEGGVADLSRSVSFHNMAGVADGVVEVAMA